MKNRNYVTSIILLMLSIAVISCKKSFLEITPKGKLIAQRTSDYSLLLTNLELLNMNADAQVPMGDEIAAVDSYFLSTSLRTSRLFRWEDKIYDPNEDNLEMITPLKNIYNYNKVINEVMNSSEGTDAQKKTIQARALAGRAWTYFLLINYYGKPYNKTTSSSDLGLPIITDADVTQTQYTRASVKEVYDFIEKDLIMAIPYLPNAITHRLIMSKGAGEGLLGKVYMFMGNFNEALPLLNKSLSDLAIGSIPVRLYDYNVTFGTGGSFLPIGTFGPTYPSVVNNEENVFAKQFSNTWGFTSNEIVINPQTVALFKASDLRLNFYTTSPYPSGSLYPAGMLRYRRTNTQFGVVLPDLYLLRAECKARLNDLAGAQDDVEKLRAKRMPLADVAVPSIISSDQKALVKFIFEERIREFAVQGYRWFDMRRLSIDPDYSSTIGKTHNVYSATGAIKETFNLQPERFVLRFSQKLIDQNPGMQNNP